MSLRSLIRRNGLAVVVCLAAISPIASADQPDRKPAAYAGNEVAGDHVLAIWQFRPGEQLEDGKGKAPLTLSGKARIVDDEPQTCESRSIWTTP